MQRSCVALIFLCTTITMTHSSRRIRVRSHGEANEDHSFDAVVGLNLAPRNLLRSVQSPSLHRGSKDAAATLSAAEVAGMKAKELREEQGRVPSKDIRDLEPIASSLVPVGKLPKAKSATFVHHHLH